MKRKLTRRVTVSATCVVGRVLYRPNHTYRVSVKIRDDLKKQGHLVLDEAV